MSSPKKQPKHTLITEVDDWGRKKFRLEEEEQRQDSPPPSDQLVEVGRNKSLLVGRQQSLNIEKYIGRVQKNKKSKAREVFYCDVCKEGFKCDMAYITHVNSPMHNRKLGFSMKVGGSSAEEVAKKLKSLKGKNFGDEESKPNQGQKLVSDDHKNESNAPDTVQENEKKNEQKEESEQSREQEQNLQQILKACGLPSSFGSKKQKR